MRAYADSNFLTRLYLLTDALPAPLPLVEGIMLAGSRFPVFWLHRIEVCNALELHVFVSKNGGEMRVTAEMAAAAQGRFTEECSSQRSPLQNVAIDERRLEQTFRNLSQRHTARQGFRTYAGERLTGFMKAKIEGWLGLKLNRDKTRVIDLRKNRSESRLPWVQLPS